MKTSVLLAVLFTALSLPSIVPSQAATPAPYYRPAPGPIAGAGLPILAIGSGAYWLAKRLRRKV